MGQQEILLVLNNSKKPMTAKEISSILDQNITNICRSLSKLIQTDDINFIEVGPDIALKHFDYKRITRRLRIFFSKELSVNEVSKSLKINKALVIHSQLF